LEAFAEFGSELDKASQAQLERGARVVEILKQRQYEPMPVERQVMSIYAVTEGHLDEIPLGDSKRFESEFLSFMEARHPDVGKHISSQGTLSEEIETKLKQAITEFKKQFVPTEEGPGAAGVVGGGPVDKLKEDVGWERVGEEMPESPVES
jgi:F-type H+-transporting ATPase subunit alpha